MKFKLNATETELREKSAELIKAIAQIYEPIDTKLYYSLRKAVSKVEFEDPVLNDMVDTWAEQYNSQTAKMLEDVVSIMDTVKKAYDEADVLKDLPEKTTTIMTQEIPNLPDYSGSVDIGEVAKLKADVALGKVGATINVAKEILESSDSKAIIFTDSVEAAKKIKSDLGDVAILHHGQMSDNAREQVKEEFQRQDSRGNFISDKRVFVTTRQSMAVGATLTAADKVIFNDLPWTAADLRQAEDRAHRIGQKNNVNVYWVTAENNIFDSTVAAIVKRKYELSKKVNQGKKLTPEEVDWMEKPVSVQELLAEIRGGESKISEREEVVKEDERVKEAPIEQDPKEKVMKRISSIKDEIKKIRSDNPQLSHMWLTVESNNTKDKEKAYYRHPNFPFYELAWKQSQLDDYKDYVEYHKKNVVSKTKGVTHWMPGVTKEEIKEYEEKQKKKEEPKLIIKEPVEQPKKKRGRPPKIKKEPVTIEPKKKRGRPPKSENQKKVESNLSYVAGQKVKLKKVGSDNVHDIYKPSVTLDEDDAAINMRVLRQEHGINVVITPGEDGVVKIRKGFDISQIEDVLSKSLSDKSWIGIDLDGTLAEYEDYKGPEHIGNPIPKMVDRVKKWLDQGKIVKIMTARANPDNNGSDSSDRAIDAIHEWTKRYIGRKLDVVYAKDLNMLELWDDRAVQVVQNTGNRADGLSKGASKDLWS